MKVTAESVSPLPFPPMFANTFSLPHGLIGFRDYTRAELLFVPDNLPFLWMKLSSSSDSVHFVVVEPGNIIPHYTPELFDEDATALQLADSSEAMVLNIVTLAQQRPLDATVNLVGPVIVNRRTRVGRQLVIANYSVYGAHYPLVEPAAAGVTHAASA